MGMMFRVRAGHARPLLRGRLAVVACGWLALAAWALAQTDDRFTEIYNRSLLKQKSVQSIRAKFTETTTSTLLVAPSVAHGTVVAAPPARVLMTYTDPEKKVLTLDGKNMVVKWPDRNERQAMNITDLQKRIDHYFTTASIKELRSMFEIVVKPETPQGRVDLIDMKPTRKQISQGLSQLELWIDRDKDVLTRMRLSFPGGDQKDIKLDAIEFNVPVTEAMFKG
jgi:outer membrane lipoprotein-sorting protein